MMIVGVPADDDARLICSSQLTVSRRQAVAAMLKIDWVTVNVVQEMQCKIS